MNSILFNRYEYHVSEKGQLEEGVSVVREELCSAVNATKEFREQLDYYYQTGKAHTAGNLCLSEKVSAEECLLLRPMLKHLFNKFTFQI